MSDKIGGISMDEIMAAAMDGLDGQENNVAKKEDSVIEPIPDFQDTSEEYSSEEKNTSIDLKDPENWDVPVIGGARQDPFAQQQSAGQAITNQGGIAPPIIGGTATYGAGTAGAAQTPEKQSVKPIKIENQQKENQALVKPEPSIQMRDFHCKSCGSPLKIPRNSKGIVTCPYCKTEAVIEGLVKNAEIADKENINSGISLDAEASVLHDITVSAIASSNLIPLDVFQKATVIREERFCVPAYMYYCNGTTSYSYEAGNIREHKTAIDLGDRTRVEKEQYVEWTLMSGMASASATLIAPGNKELASVVQELYSNYSPGDLIDVEELEFPYDVETYNYNLPQSAAFNEYVRPEMERLLLEKAEESLRGRRYRNLSASGGSNIQKDEFIRLFLGVYRIVYEYEGEEYYIYVTGDGKHYTYDRSPVDEKRRSELQELQNKKNSIDEKKGLNILLIVGIVICAITGIFTLRMLYGVPFLLAGGLGFLLYKNKKMYSDNLSAANVEINAFDEQRKQALNDFKQNQQMLQGLYSIN